MGFRIRPDKTLFSMFMYVYAEELAKKRLSFDITLVFIVLVGLNYPVLRFGLESIYCKHRSEKLDKCLVSQYWIVFLSFRRRIFRKGKNANKFRKHASTICIPIQKGYTTAYVSSIQVGTEI